MLGVIDHCAFGEDTWQRLNDKRVLLTQATDYMGPATLELFSKEGAEVVAAAGYIDILVANLASSNYSGIEAGDLEDRQWHKTFDMMVHSLHKLCQVVLPQMMTRKAGKIVVYGTAAQQL